MLMETTDPPKSPDVSAHTAEALRQIEMAGIHLVPEVGVVEMLGLVVLCLALK